MKTVGVFVAVKRSDGAWDLFVRVGAKAPEWRQVTTPHGILPEYLHQGAGNLADADQPWAVLCFGGEDHDAADGIQTSETPWRHPNELKAALKSWRERPGGSRAKAPAVEAPPPIDWSNVFVHHDGLGYQLTAEGYPCRIPHLDRHTVQETARSITFTAQDCCLLVARLGTGWGGFANAHLLPRYPGLAARLDALFPVAAPVAPAASPEQTKEKLALPPCGFCPEEGLYPEHYRHCGQHGGAAEAHAARLTTGGLVDCPGTRIESLRFADRKRIELEASAAQIIGFRTQNDRAKGAQLAISERSTPADPPPAAGMTPHYEWP